MAAHKLAVVADMTLFDRARDVFEGLVSTVEQWPEEDHQGGELLEELFERGCTRLVVFGGDDLVGRVFTAYRRRPALGSDPLSLWPLSVDGSFVAKHAGEPDSAARAARLIERGIDEWHHSRVGTLKVTASARPAANFGFSFGTGWVYRAMEAKVRSRGGMTNFLAAFGELATETVAGDEDDAAVAARATIDYRAVDEPTGSLVASTLAKTPFGAGIDGDGAVVWKGLSAGRLVRRAVAARMFDRREDDARRFETIHLDTPQGWVLDGRLYGADTSQVVQVVPGPTVGVCRPKTGLRAAMGRWFR